MKKLLITGFIALVVVVSGINLISTQEGNPSHAQSNCLPSR